MPWCANLQLAFVSVRSSSFLQYWSSAESFVTGVLEIAQVLQMFVLGPRLILSIREYHAGLVTRSDGGTCMTSIYFQAGGDVLTGGDV
jgi:hypothetical protein